MKRFFPSMADLRAFFRQSWSMASKELSAYFGSPIALIFVGVFLAATLSTPMVFDEALPLSLIPSPALSRSVVPPASIPM